jgi:SecD/SecF fusion protein
MPRWLIVLLILFVGFILLSMAAFITLPWILQFFTPQVGTVLVYEMKDVKPTQDALEMAAKTVVALNERLNPSYLRRAKVRVIEGNRIEVGIYGNDPKAVEEVAALVEFSGKLEFRILANAHKHKDIIDLAKNEPDKSVYNEGEKWLARWSKVRQGEKFSPMNLTRERTRGDKTWTEVLLVNDIYNVTGDFLANAKPGIDEYGKPCVLFSFTPKGGQLFGMLTGDNLPNQVQPELKNQLGIILDGVLYSAPNIQSTITDNGQITGDFTLQEVNLIVECLNAGSLPANLRKVDERRVDSK